MSFLKSFISLFKRKDESARRLEKTLSDPIESEIALIDIVSLKVITFEMRKRFPQIRNHDMRDIHRWCFAAVFRKRIADLRRDNKEHGEKLLIRLRQPQHHEIQQTLLELIYDQQETYEMTGPNSICHGETEECVYLANSLFVPVWLAGKLLDDRESILELKSMLFESLNDCYNEAFSM